MNTLILDQYMAMCATTEGDAKLFNRITENSADVNAMFTSGDADFQRIADGYWRYQASLREDNISDQAHLQQHLLDFLGSDMGKLFLFFDCCKDF